MKTCPLCGKTYADTFQLCSVDGTALVPIVSKSADPMLGSLLAGRFLLTEKLGQGGMGTVYKAVHTQMDRVCAIKVLSPATADSESAVARFKREARMASRIDNPHAVTIYDFGEAQGGLLYLAMEFIDGKPLTQILAQHTTLPLDRVVRITSQIAEALAAAHSLGIVHRDLKPDNIMITRKAADEDYVKVLDFGIAKAVAEDSGDHLTKTGFVLGTPVYMSPEQLSGEKLDARSDVYSLAIIAYEMLSGRLPFEGDNPQSIMIKRVTTPPKRLREHAPHISESIEQAVMSGLARDSGLRPQTAEAFANGLRDAVHKGTQGISGLATSPMSDEGSAKSTVPISDRGTMIEGSPLRSDILSDKTYLVGSPVREQETPTVALDQEKVTSTPDPETVAYPSPSQYVTQPSTASPVAEQAVTEEPQAISEERRPTIALDSAQSVKPTAPQLTPQPGEEIYRRTPQYGQPPQTVASRQEITSAPQPKSKVAVLVGLLVAGIIVLAGLGYLLYSFYTKSQPPAPTSTEASRTGAPSETTPPSSNLPDKEAARGHYEAGKKHQEQAYLLAEGGSKKEAVEESKKAISEYRQAIALQPQFPEAHENLAVALYNTDDVEAAASEYEIAIKQYENPTAQVLTNYGFALLKLKRFRPAVDAFDRALKNDPNDYDLHYYHGFALHYLGDTSGAQAAFRQYLSLSPKGQYAKEVREILAGRAEPLIEN